MGRKCRPLLSQFAVRGDLGPRYLYSSVLYRSREEYRIFSLWNRSSRSYTLKQRSQSPIDSGKA